MNRISFLRSAGVGLLISLVSASSYYIFNVFLDAYSAWALSISLATFLALLFITRNGSLKQGGISLLLLYAGSCLIALLLAPSIGTLAIFNVLWLWVARSLVWHKHVISSLADLILCGTSLVATVAVGDYTQSAFMTYWSFFLAQSLIIPIVSFCRQQLLGETELNDTKMKTAQTSHDHFERARRNAEKSLQALVRRSNY